MKCYLNLILKGLIVISISAVIILGANVAMDNFLESELDDIRAFAIKEESAATFELECLKLEQQEAFYQKYSNRDCYHYYGQFYEIFKNVYNADIWFMGTSHAAHGVNPLYVENECAGYSFFNFSLNGSNPKYYEDWWDIVLEAGYPMPDTIIWCVDWFMCDDNWLWRTINYDTAANMPIDIMRRLCKTEARTADDAEIKETDSDDKTVIDDTVATEENKIKWWDIDAITDKIFSKLSIISLRDRIPDMVRSWFSALKSDEKEDIINNDMSETEAYSDNLILPTYNHSYKRDSSGNITSDYYKGYIPWDVGFNGDSSTVSCADNEEQWNSFERLIDKFNALGIKIIFIEIPEYSGVNRIKMNKNNARITDIAAKYGIEFYDYNTIDASGVGADPSNYSDWGHMNKKGSTLFSKFFGGEIKNILAGNIE